MPLAAINDIAITKILTNAIQNLQCTLLGKWPSAIAMYRKINMIAETITALFFLSIESMLSSNDLSAIQSAFNLIMFGF